MPENYRRIPMPQRKVQAALELIYNVGARRSTTAARRILRACKILDLTPEETITIFHRLEYCDQRGNPYNSRIKKVW